MYQNIKTFPVTIFNLIMFANKVTDFRAAILINLAEIPS